MGQEDAFNRNSHGSNGAEDGSGGSRTIITACRGWTANPGA